ncbi:MAG: STAS domain-containing protein [Firmicutes bacterium]|uniref:STAS domain-containing protein n=1 Tax=Limnochorda sp. TaxID=1940279 RepID=UPI0017B557C4|nr:STAS domain-containing protein [Bacillota bacterium]
MREAVNRLFDQKVSFPQVLARLTPACELINVVVEAYQDDTQRALTAVLALSRMHSAVASLAGEVYAARRAEEVQEEQRRIIRELSTPVIEVWDGVLAMPLVGMVDSARAKQMMEQLLNRIVERQSRIVILDVTGVPSIDSGVADHLIRTTRAARLVGARSILAGISPQVAVTLVRMGISFGDLETVSDLRSALALALEMLGYKVVGPAS